MASRGLFRILSNLEIMRSIGVSTNLLIFVVGDESHPRVKDHQNSWILKIRCIHVHTIGIEPALSQVVQRETQQLMEYVSGIWTPFVNTHA